MRRYWLFASFAFGACSASEESHPPQFSPDATGSAPRKCEEVRKGEVHGNAVWVDGQPAACGADGMQCAVFDLASFGGICAAGTPYAVCQLGKWVIHCDQDAAVLDASIGDSAGDG